MDINELKRKIVAKRELFGAALTVLDAMADEVTNDGPDSIQEALDEAPDRTDRPRRRRAPRRHLTEEHKRRISEALRKRRGRATQ